MSIHLKQKPKQMMRHMQIHNCQNLHSYDTKSGQIISYYFVYRIRLSRLQHCLTVYFISLFCFTNNIYTNHVFFWLISLVLKLRMSICITYYIVDGNISRWLAIKWSKFVEIHKFFFNQ